MNTRLFAMQATIVGAFLVFAFFMADLTVGGDPEIALRYAVMFGGSGAGITWLAGWVTSWALNYFRRREPEPRLETLRISRSEADRLPPLPTPRECAN